MITRTIFEDLKKHLSKKEISLIVGPRQAGKTTLMRLLQEYLEKTGEKTLFLSLDFDRDRPFFSSQDRLFARIELEMGRARGFVFIDEIQRREDAGVFLKGLYDLELPYKFVVSGSGSLELKEKIHESLVGRKRIFELGTISFEEFVNFRTGGAYNGRLDEFFAVEKDRTGDLLREYLRFGGYPRVVIEPELGEKTRIIDDIYRSYLERDIAYLLQVAKPESFSSLIRVLAGQAGGLVNYSELASEVAISQQTIKNYLWFAEKTFVISRLTPFFKNVKKEITRAPVVYFNDLGLKNYAVGLFGTPVERSGNGFLFQNLVYNIIRDKTRFTPIRVNFWRTKDKAEVDFVLDHGQGVIPVEVKFKDMKKEKIGRSLRSFISKYGPEQAWIVNLGLRETVTVESTRVRIIPFFDLLRLLPNIQGE